MSEELKIAIEELDALIHELLSHEGKGAMMAGDVAVKLMDMRDRIFERVSATMPVPFAKPSTPDVV